ncbi:MAG: BON domain-containing protein [Rhodospirillaceae bacterium]|nr:BON domain-containing protein [Rhodospirillaceae bacterium]
MMKAWARKFCLGVTLAALTGGLGGCASAVIGSGATVGLAAAQERTVGQAVEDTAILAEINHHLLQRSEVLFANVDVEVVEGRVLLTGNVRDPGSRVEVARMAWQAQGVREVLNELEISDQSSLRNYAKDVWITTQLKIKLLGDAEISAINYSVDTLNSVVYLFGIGQTQAELDRATGHARNIRGVSKVVSHVILKDDPKRNQ